MFTPDSTLAGEERRTLRRPTSSTIHNVLTSKSISIRCGPVRAVWKSVGCLVSMARRDRRYGGCEGEKGENGDGKGGIEVEKDWGTRFMSFRSAFLLFLRFSLSLLAWFLRHCVACCLFIHCGEHARRRTQIGCRGFRWCLSRRLAFGLNLYFFVNLRLSLFLLIRMG